MSYQSRGSFKLFFAAKEPIGKPSYDHLLDTPSYQASYFLVVKAPVGKLMIQLKGTSANNGSSSFRLFFALKAPLRKPSYDHSLNRGPYQARDLHLLSYFLIVKAPVGKLMVQLLIRVPNQLMDHHLLSYFLLLRHHLENL
jgi:hypothetical protein